MDEAQFWPALEYRVCSELMQMQDKELRRWWCDGFLNQRLDAERGAVTGTVWMGRGARHQEAWEFELLLRGPHPGEQGEWAALFPSEGVTGWLSLDLSKKAMTIDLNRLGPMPLGQQLDSI